MSENNTVKPLSLALGTAFALSLAASPLAAAENPFSVTPVAGSQMVADKNFEHEGKCGEGKCGEGDEGKCGEGKCGS